MESPNEQGGLSGTLLCLSIQILDRQGSFKSSETMKLLTSIQWEAEIDEEAVPS